MNTPGQLLKEARARHGVSQKQLARRASTTQSAISRVERDKVSPSVETLRELLFLLGEDMELRASLRDSGIDATLIDQSLRRSPTERLDYGVAFANMVIANSPNPRREPMSVDRTLPPKAPEFRELLGPLIAHGVDFVLIGGQAGISHGSTYPSYDLDVIYARDRDNVARLVSALEEIGVRLRGAPRDLPFQLDTRTIENGANFTFETPYGDLDVLADAAGMRSYESLKSGSVEREVSGHLVRVAAIDDLIAMKKAAGRTKDKLKVEEYIVIARPQRATDDGG